MLCRPEFWSHITDDFSPAPEDYVPVESERIHYLLVKDGDELLGLVMFVEHSPVLWEIHVNFLAPCWWAMKAQPAFAAALAWAWANSGCQRIVAAVADSPHRTNLKLPATVGMTRYGLNPRCIQRQGKLLDQYLFGISRP